MSQDCSFLFAHSVFSKVYIGKYMNIPVFAIDTDELTVNKFYEPFHTNAIQKCY